MIRKALKNLESRVERLLIGKPEPTPKAIRDLGKSTVRASQVQDVISAINKGYDSEGNYHSPELRTEHIVIERTDIAQFRVDL